MASATALKPQCTVSLDGQRCFMVDGHDGDHFTSHSMRYCALYKPSSPGAAGRLPDERLAWLAGDRTGARFTDFAEGTTFEERLAIVDELIAWRRYKLTDEEKVALRTVRETFTGADTREVEGGNEDVHELAWSAIERITGKAK
jgi:hypothetical protein